MAIIPVSSQQNYSSLVARFDLKIVFYKAILHVFIYTFGQWKSDTIVLKKEVPEMDSKFKPW